MLFRLMHPVVVMGNDVTERTVYYDVRCSSRVERLSVACHDGDDDDNDGGMSPRGVCGQPQIWALPPHQKNPTNIVLAVIILRYMAAPKVVLSPPKKNPLQLLE